MKIKAITMPALGLICLTAAGCVSEGGSYVVRDSAPRYERIDGPGRDYRGPGIDRRDRDGRFDRRDDDRRDRDRLWNGQRGSNDFRGQGDARDRDRSSRYESERDGRWIMRDGRRIWIPAGR